MVLGVALCLASLVADAANLLEIYRLARDNDPKWRAAGFDYEASAETRAQARAALLPTVTFEQEHIRTDQNVLSSNNPIFGLGQSRYATDGQVLTIKQPLFRMALWSRLVQSEVVVKQAAATHAAAEQELMLRVASTYLGALAARDALALALAARDAIGKPLDLAQARLDRGLGTVSNLYDARSRYAVTEAREIEARFKLLDANQALREITGKTIETINPLRDTIPLSAPEPASVEQWVETAEKQNWRLEARRQTAEVAREEIRRQRAGHAPTVNLVGTNNYRRAGGTVFGGGAHTETRDLSIRLAVPIFEGGATTSLTREAVARHSKALEELEFERRLLDRQTRAAYQGVLSGINLVKALNNTVAAQEKAVETKDEGRKAGLFTLMPVLDATRDLYFARRDYAQARYDYLLNRLRLKEAAGTLGEEDLAAINMLLQ